VPLPASVDGIMLFKNVNSVNLNPPSGSVLVLVSEVESAKRNGVPFSHSAK